MHNLCVISQAEKETAAYGIISLLNQDNRFFT